MTDVVCDRCGNEYKDSMETCPDCNSSIRRSDWTIESEYIRSSPPFSVHVNEGYNDEEKRVFRISKLIPTDDGAEYRGTNINSAEDFQQVINAMDDLYPHTGWKKKPDLVEELSEDYESQETVDEILRQYPSFLNDVLETTNFENYDEGDFEFLAEAIENLNRTVLQAERQIKNTFTTLLESLSEQDGEGYEELNDLLQEWHLLQITSTSNVLLSRLEFLDTFEEMIHNDDVYEIQGDDSIHRSLERNMWILDERYWLVQSNRSLRTFIQEELADEDEEYEQRRPDFVCAIQGKNLILAEIKRPSHTLARNDLDQLEDYYYIARKYRGGDFDDVVGYLIGNAIEEEAKEVIQNRNNLKIKTYDEVLSAARNRYREYLDAMDGNHAE